MEFSTSITRTCALQMMCSTYERTYASSTMSRHSGAKTKWMYMVLGYYRGNKVFVEDDYVI